MLEIRRYREMIAEIAASVNRVANNTIGASIVAVSEKHLVKKLKDRTGLVLCANYPDATARGERDNVKEENDVVLFLLEKVASGQDSDEEELQRFARIQETMAVMKDVIRGERFFCGEIDVRAEMKTEWEYDIFGGWMGMSLGIKILDYDDTID